MRVMLLRTLGRTSPCDVTGGARILLLAWLRRGLFRALQSRYRRAECGHQPVPAWVRWMSGGVLRAATQHRANSLKARENTDSSGHFPTGSLPPAQTPSRRTWRVADGRQARVWRKIKTALADKRAAGASMGWPGRGPDWGSRNVPVAARTTPAQKPWWRIAHGAEVPRPGRERVALKEAAQKSGGKPGYAIHGGAASPIEILLITKYSIASPLRDYISALFCFCTDTTDQGLRIPEFAST